MASDRIADESILLQFALTHRGLGEATVRPIINAKACPEILDCEAGRSTLDWLARLSKPLGTGFEPRGDAAAPVAIRPPLRVVS